MSSESDPHQAPIELTWKQRSVVFWPLARTARSFLRLHTGKDMSGAPAPNMVLRVGVVGHIDIDEHDALKAQIGDVLNTLQTALADSLPIYRSAFPTCDKPPDAECRLISQLAAGSDQLVAECALEQGYILECPLPVERQQFAADIARNPGKHPDSVSRFYALLGKAKNVLELEVLPQNEFIPNEVYESSAWTLLLHSDVVLSLVRSDAKLEVAGTKWLIEEATKRAVPVIEILVDDPPSGRVIRADDLNTQDMKLAGSQWATQLVASLALPPRKQYSDSGPLIERFRNNVQANEEEWPPAWTSSRDKRKLASSEAADWTKRTGKDLYKHWRWAERRANTYRDLYQGAYLSLAFLALAAVAGAMVGVFTALHHYAPWGKFLEILAIIAMLIILKATTKGFWRQRWLSYRWLEQQIRNATILNLVGRTVPAQSSPILSEVQKKEGAWIAWYLRTILRQAHLPSARLDQLALSTAGELILHGQIGRQLDYYHKQSHRAHLANHQLETKARRALWLTLVTAICYFVSNALARNAFVTKVLHDAALATGLFGPAFAAAIAAIRAQGEFVQLETRYKGVHDHLLTLRHELTTMLGSGDALNGRSLAQVSYKAASAMLDEVSHWRSLLHTNEPEL